VRAALHSQQVGFSLRGTWVRSIYLKSSLASGVFFNSSLSKSLDYWSPCLTKTSADQLDFTAPFLKPVVKLAFTQMRSDFSKAALKLSGLKSWTMGLLACRLSVVKGTGGAA